MTPITREEYFLAKINGDDVPTPAPITRVEKYYDIIAGNDGAILPPVTREEFFLAKIAGLDIAVPEPETRIEKYLAIIAGEDIVAPIPITRKEFYLAIWAEDKPETHTGTIVAFVAKKVKPMQIKAQLEPTQDLHGYDNPWPAGGGTNLLDPDEIEVYGSTNIHVFYDNGFLLKANTSYIFSVSETAAGLYFQKYSDSSNIATSYGKTFVTYTPTEDILIMLNAYYSGQYPAPSGGLSSVKCQLEKGSSATTYSPYANICPITGHTGVTVYRTGKNLFNVDDVANISVYSTNRNGCYFRKAGKYTVSAQNSGDFMYCRTFNADGSTKSTYYVVSGTTITNATFTIQDGEFFAVYDAVESAVSASKTKFEAWECQVELSDTTTDYEAYQGNTYPITFPALGKNLFDGVLEQGSINAATGADTASTNNVRSKNYTPITAGETYYYQKKDSTYGFYIYFYAADKSFLRYVDGNGLGASFTAQETDAFVRFRYNSTGDVSDLEAQEIMLSKGDARKTYEPYTNTVYNGTLTVNEDGSGEIVVDMGSVDLGSLSWAYNSEQARFYVTFSSAKVPASNAQKANMICSMYPVDIADRSASSNYDNIITLSTGSVLSVRNSAYSDADVFKTAMSGVQLVYELATPVTIPLTAEQVGEIMTLKGNNVVWVDDSDEIEVVA